MTGNALPDGAEVYADDPEDTEELYRELSGIPGISVGAAPATAQPGEQGAALDVLMVGLSSGAVTAFLQIVKTLAEAKGPKFVLRIRRGKDRLTITADSLEDVAKIEQELRRLFGGR